MMLPKLKLYILVIWCCIVLSSGEDDKNCPPGSYGHLCHQVADTDADLKPEFPESIQHYSEDKDSKLSYDQEDALQYASQTVSSGSPSHLVERVLPDPPLYVPWPQQTYSDIQRRSAKELATNAPYGFRPRSIPLRRSEELVQEKPVYYAKDNISNRYKTEVLFPGNYYAISKEKSVSQEKETPPQVDQKFKPQIIPLIRGRTFEKRSLNADETPIKHEEASERSSSRRSSPYDPEYTNDRLQASDSEARNSISEIIPDVDSMTTKLISIVKHLSNINNEGDNSLGRSLSSYIYGSDDDGDGDEEDEDYEVEEAGSSADDRSKHKIGHQIKHKIKKIRKYSKYMMPLLLAYKLKYFALVPVLISGLVLLVGATGLAGFFFALFAAVMGLQKGGY